ncbi:hypothetical protein G6F42_023866 [Rhizopus arrhizus]|nr:hypothetical protein G6F42_023866 [Rhizopus arrhizus]
MKERSRRRRVVIRIEQETLIADIPRVSSQIGCQNQPSTTCDPDIKQELDASFTFGLHDLKYIPPEVSSSGSCDTATPMKTTDVEIKQDDAETDNKLLEDGNSSRSD